MKNISYRVQPLNQIGECRSQKTLRTLENRFEKFDSVKCDEFKHAFFDKYGFELFFNHLSLRCARKSTIIINLSFERCREILGDIVLTAAMVDTGLCTALLL